MNDLLENLSYFLRNDDITRFNIPIYQRSYEWKKQQVDQFLEDIEGLMDDDTKGSYHFLGMIVYVNKEDYDGEVEIIDGQQRLTSITLLLFCLYHRINDADDKHEVLSLLFSKKAGEKSFNINVEERNPCLLAIKNRDEEFDFTNHSESVKFIWERWKDLNELLDEKKCWRL